MSQNNLNCAKIYGITDNMTNKYYIGSTTKSLTRRLSNHKGKCRHSPTRPLYRHMFDIGFKNISIELLEDYPCQTREELRQREQYWIDYLQPELNQKNAHLTEETRRKNWANYMRQYRIEHMEQTAMSRKRYNEKRRNRTNE